MPAVGNIWVGLASHCLARGHVWRVTVRERRHGSGHFSAVGSCAGRPDARPTLRASPPSTFARVLRAANSPEAEAGAMCGLLHRAAAPGGPEMTRADVA
jgi:hypothetical protein